jgi:long-chain acyl-CoA synthetase
VNEHTVPLVVPADPTANATDLLVERAAATPNEPLFSVPDGTGGWTDVTAAEFAARVREVAKGLIAAGIQPGDVA